MRQIAENSPTDRSLSASCSRQGYDYGYDAQQGEFTMVQGGTIRPDQGSAPRAAGRWSVAGLLITTEAMVAEKPEPDF